MQFILKRRFEGKIATGISGILICFAVALIYWPIWGTLSKAIITTTAAEGLAAVDSGTAEHFIRAFTEATFFWCCINAWTWQTLIFGNYGKYALTERQPWAGIWYTCLMFVSGIAAFMVIIPFIGVWWHPFNLSLLFSPVNAEEVKLGLAGWEAAGFYVLPVLICQIPFVSLFQKKPWAGNLKPPLDGLALMMTSSAFALIVWVGIFIPSFFHLQLNGTAITAQPLGSWPQVLAFCQGFIFWFLLPAEGGEGYPYKALSGKQPWMGLAGLVIALVAGGILMPKCYVALISTLSLNEGVNPYVTAASLELSNICFLLFWHHLFDDYPGVDLESNGVKRFFKRLAIWLIGGSLFGFIWLKAYPVLPFAGNNLGMGFPVMGILAGQFALLMAALMFNTFFDKWPLVYKAKNQ
jgi:AAT family amino acid transporter